MERHWKVVIPVILAVLVTAILGACAPAAPAEEETVAPPAEEETTPEVAEEAPLSEQQKWEQFKGKGIQINFLSEDTPAIMSLGPQLPEFEKLTGIKVNVTAANVADLTNKLMLDLSTGSSNVQVVYITRWQILPAFPLDLADLRKFMEDPTLSQPEGGMTDFFETHLVATSFFIDRDRQVGIPVDASTMVLFYRKDIFDKYKDKFMAEKGYDPTPSGDMTWNQYYEVAKWINDNVEEVEYGAGHMAKMFNSLYCDFSNVLFAWGAKRYENPDTESWGTLVPGRSLLDEPRAIEAANFYKDLISIAHPASISWDWSELAEAFAAGKVAMAPNWHDFAAVFENPERSTVVGKVGYSLLPKGPYGDTANYYSGAALGINAHASEELQRATWLFLVWATSAEVQKKGIPVGATPTRISVYEDPEVKKMIEDKVNPVVGVLPLMQEAWQWENIEFVEAKIPMFVETMVAEYTELSLMVTGKKSPEQAMKDAAKRINEITGYAKTERK